MILLIFVNIELIKKKKLYNNIFKIVMFQMSI